MPSEGIRIDFFRLSLSDGRHKQLLPQKVPHGACGGGLRGRTLRPPGGNQNALGGGHGNSEATGL